MKKRNWLILSALSVLLVSGVILAAGCASPPEPITANITAQEAFTLIQDYQGDPDFMILDVRTPEEYAEGHIENAVNIDFKSATFSEELDKLDRWDTYLIHCRSGKRSEGAFGVMQAMEFIRIYHMNGGILEWIEEGLPLVK